jgi:hypothetical protein
MFVALVLVYPETVLTKVAEFTVPVITWFNKISLRTSVGTSDKDAKPLSVKNVSKAKLFGASTVYSPPLNTSTKFPSATDKAATKLLRSEVFNAIYTIFNWSVR